MPWPARSGCDGKVIREDTNNNGREEAEISLKIKKEKSEACLRLNRHAEA